VLVAAHQASKRQRPLTQRCCLHVASITGQPAAQVDTERVQSALAGIYQLTTIPDSALREQIYKSLQTTIAQIITEKTERIDEKDKRIDEIRATIAVIIAEKDKRIDEVKTEKDKVIAEKDKRIDEVIAEKDKRIDEVKTEKDKRIDEVKTEKDMVIYQMDKRIGTTEQLLANEKTALWTVKGWLTVRNIIEATERDFGKQPNEQRTTWWKKFLEAAKRMGKGTKEARLYANLANCHSTPQSAIVLAGQIANLYGVCSSHIHVPSSTLDELVKSHVLEQEHVCIAMSLGTVMNVHLDGSTPIAHIDSNPNP